MNFVDEARVMVARQKAKLCLDIALELNPSMKQAKAALAKL